VPDKILEQHHTHILIARDGEISSECFNYDLVVWRGWHLILSTSCIPGLLDVLGMNERFARWLILLLKTGEIPSEDRPVLKEHLVAAHCKDCDELLRRLILPFERRFEEGRSIDHLSLFFGQDY
jgi:hypothetical protein